MFNGFNMYEIFTGKYNWQTNPHYLMMTTLQKPFGIDTPAHLETMAQPEVKPQPAEPIVELVAEPDPVESSPFPRQEIEEPTEPAEQVAEQVAEPEWPAQVALSDLETKSRSILEETPVPLTLDVVDENPSGITQPAQNVYEIEKQSFLPGWIRRVKGK